MLKDKKIVLGVTGGIAAYKAAGVVSKLKQAGAEVRVIMTKEAAEFVTPLTFRELSGSPVAMDMWAEVTHWNVAHIALANWADVFLVAPATANVLAKAANGIADDLLTTTLLATKAPIIFAPAMNTNMYENPLTQKNIAALEELGCQFIEPASGHLACGVSGKGRLPEPETIVEAVDNFFSCGDQLKGKKVLVTAAGTIEPIDPVRFIGNRSSGRMGYAIAAEAKQRGADVVLVSGPSALTAPAGVHLVKVETTGQMREAVLKEFSDADIIIKAAAVADYKAKTVADNKIKKVDGDDELVIELEKNPDILKELGSLKKSGQILVGFAAETQNLLTYAKSKLEKKNLDYIVANDVSKPNAGFNVETNLIKLLSRDGSIEEFPLMKKTELAKIILDRVIKK